jgi:hypothetical protein
MSTSTSPIVHLQILVSMLELIVIFCLAAFLTYKFLR